MIMNILILSRKSVFFCLEVYVFFHEAKIENAPVFLAWFVIKPFRECEIDINAIAESWDIFD